MSSLSDVDIAVFLQRGKGKSAFDIKLSLYAELCRVLNRNDIDIVLLNTTINVIHLDEIISKLDDVDSGIRQIENTL